MAADVFSLFLEDFTGRLLIQMEILGYLAIVPKRPSLRTLGSQSAGRCGLLAVEWCGGLCCSWRSGGTVSLFPDPRDQLQGQQRMKLWETTPRPPPLRGRLSLPWPVVRDRGQNQDLREMN